MPVFAEGQVEQQKLNQVAALLLPGWILLLPGWVFGVQLDYSSQKSKRRGADHAVHPHINLDQII